MVHTEARSVALRVLEARQASSNPFDRLLIPRTAPFEEVKAAYKRLLFLHPDKNPDLEIAADAFTVVREAFEKIKQQVEGSLAPQADLGRPTGFNRWSAFTGSAAAPAAFNDPRASAPQNDQPPLQRQTVATSKWGRPSTDAQRMLKVPAPGSALNPEAAGAVAHRRRSQDSFSEDRRDSDSLGPSRWSNEGPQDPEEGQGVGCDVFYGKTSRKRANSSIGGPTHGRFSEAAKKEWKRASGSNPSEKDPVAAVERPAQASKWSNYSKTVPLADLLKNPGLPNLPTFGGGATFAGHAAEKGDEKKKHRPASNASRRPSSDREDRRKRNRVVLDSESSEDDEIESSDEEEVNAAAGVGPKRRAVKGARNRKRDEVEADSESEEWGTEQSGDEIEIEDVENRGSGGAVAEGRAAVDKANNSKKVLSMLLAQQQSESRRNMQAELAAAQRAKRTAAARRAFGKKKGKSRQSKLKLAPVVSSRR